MYRLDEVVIADGTKWYFFEIPGDPMTRFVASWPWFWWGKGP